MTKLTMRDLETTPEASKPFLEKSFKANGRTPGLHGVLANSPELLEGYQKLHELFINSSFDKEELTVVWQTINVEHECYYCVPAHTGIANKMQVDLALTEALRDGKPMPTEKLQALQDTTLQMVRKRGAISDEEVQAFLRRVMASSNCWKSFWVCPKSH